MTSELDFQQLLQPISEESAVGQDLRPSGDPSNLYRQVRDARSSARDREQRDDRGDDRAADEASAIEQWQKTSTLAQKYLQTVGKDLEVVACLLEAQVRVNGLGGLSAVIELSAGLIDRYWGQLYPSPDEDGYETTMLPLSRLNSEAIIYPLQRLQISETSGAEVLLVWQTDQAQRVEALKRDQKFEEADRLVNRGAWTIDRVQQLVSSTSDDFYRRLHRDLQRSRTALESLLAVIASRVEEAAQPVFHKFREGFNAIESSMRLAGGVKWAAASSAQVVAPAGQQVATAPLGGAVAVASVSAGVTVGISGREQAFHRLEEVAQWFEKHEPQSLIPYEVRKVLRRGRMKPEQLFMELIPDESARNYFFRDLGMEMPEQS